MKTSAPGAQLRKRTVATLYAPGTMGRHASHCVLCFVFNVRDREAASVIQCDALCNCRPEVEGDHLWSCPALGGYVCDRCEEQIRVDGEVDDALRHALKFIRAEVVRRLAWLTVTEFDVTFERQVEPESDCAPIVARELLVSGKCSAACLLANGFSDCECSCDGQYHGALLDEEVPRQRVAAKS